MHQTLSRQDAVQFVTARYSGTAAAGDLQAAPSQLSTEDCWEEIDDAIAYVCSQFGATDVNAFTSDRSRDALEGDLSASLHQGLVSLPAAVLSDRGFWRYCSAALYDFVYWRQPAASLTALLPYFGASSESISLDCVPHRMFNRANIAFRGSNGEADPYALARFGAADVWKSHILRVRNSYAPVLVRELLTDVQAGNLPTDRVRPLARNLRRVRSNVLFEVLDTEQARVLLDREQARL